MAARFASRTAPKAARGSSSLYRQRIARPVLRDLITQKRVDRIDCGGVVRRDLDDSTHTRLAIPVADLLLERLHLFGACRELSVGRKRRVEVALREVGRDLL